MYRLLRRDLEIELEKKIEEKIEEKLVGERITNPFIRTMTHGDVINEELEAKLFNKLEAELTTVIYKKLYNQIMQDLKLELNIK